MLSRTSVAAYHNYNYLIMNQNLTDHLPDKDKKDKVRQRLWKVRAKKVILATGSIERPMGFDSSQREKSGIVDEELASRCKKN